MSEYGVLLVSHVSEIVEGLTALLKEVASDVSITSAGGTDDGGIGSSFDKVQAAVEANQSGKILAFYDLGSSKMNLEMVKEVTDKEITLFDTAFIESAYTASALLQAGVPIEEIKKQLEPLKIK
ncbi:PTS-dependent dihydroxyacetone kinase phosphotransferase subunit DhaM [Sporolactobacillus shoreae]|uniref:phosphoenolpyruvate--glycerone phosphotransferase n=1 Tax=Sporolactobacillus shoreae TaxID=1465501 RepID=A0A4Z0GML1_9BACL|nr:dihydroxyacetone kinase phosphoryl donor subunit DhaM [Sporolactobacillus shoreae]TGA98084.1 PTS-dependent dihydroxyacetone kinase phosphotransferase subunit DhaM [Sporolactobacillus shoreae]